MIARQLTKANESGEEAQKLIDLGLRESKNKVKSNSKARTKV